MSGLQGSHEFSFSNSPAIQFRNETTNLSFQFVGINDDLIKISTFYEPGSTLKINYSNNADPFTTRFVVYPIIVPIY